MSLVLTLSQFERLKPTFETYHFYKRTHSMNASQENRLNLDIMEGVLKELRPTYRVDRSCPACVVEMFRDLFERSNFNQLTETHGKPIPPPTTTVTRTPKPKK